MKGLPVRTDSMTKVLGYGFAWGLSALLAACGGGSDEAQPALPAAANYFPGSVGDNWSYATSLDSNPAQLSRVSVTGMQTVHGSPAAVFETVSRGLKSQEVVLVSVDGVARFSATGGDESSPGWPLMTFPLQFGVPQLRYDRTEDSGADHDGDGVNDQVRTRLTLLAIGTEAVITPAGDFADTLHLRETNVSTYYYSRDGSTADITATRDAWHAMGIGRVQSTLRLVGLDAGYNYTVTETLLEYRVSSRSGRAGAPKVMDVTPGVAPLRAADVVVSTTFTQPFTLRPDWADLPINVTDAADRRLAGGIDVRGNTLIFVPSEPWTDGTYTARVTTDVRSLLGDKLAADYVWTFTVSR